jgi:hypothetical protein
MSVNLKQQVFFLDVILYMGDDMYTINEKVYSFCFQRARYINSGRALFSVSTDVP